jgi:CO/xanthine dehydrogenase FAD-binding subunit
MRPNPADYELRAPGNLPAVLSLLSTEPGTWRPIAGGTDLMVLYAAGKLTARKLVSIWNLAELRQIEILSDEVRIGAACTYTDLRKHEIVRGEFPLLASAAAWTGGIANQNRGTLGGNIANASPAADSLPALLVYEAEVILASAQRERRVAYKDFHLDYKKTILASDELVRAVCLPRQFSSYFCYSRKVGARNAQAISKVAVAALGRLEAGAITDVRIALGSVAPTPIRLNVTEQFLRGKRIDSALIERATNQAALEIRPISDIRSTARYRTAVSRNLLAEFLDQLGATRQAV